MELNSSFLNSVLERTDHDKNFLRNFASFVLFMYNHMIYVIGIPQLILNLMVASVIIYSSQVRPRIKYLKIFADTSACALPVP